MIENKCTVIVYDTERKKEWEEILGTNEVPAKSIFTHTGNFPIVGKQQYYECDLDRLTKLQKTKLVKHIAKKFNITEVDVWEDIEKVGVPILAKDCIASDEARRYL